MKLKPNYLVAFSLFILATIDIVYYFTPPPTITSPSLKHHIADYIQQDPAFLPSLVTPTLDNRYRLYQSLSELDHELSRNFSFHTLYLMIQENDKQICWNRAIPDSIYSMLSVPDSFPEVIRGYYRGTVPLSPTVLLMFIALPDQPSSSWSTFMNWLNILILIGILFKISQSYPKSILTVLTGLIALELFLPNPAASPGFNYHPMLFILPFGISLQAFELTIILIGFILMNLIISRMGTGTHSPVPHRRNQTLILIYSSLLNGVVFYGLTELILENEQYFLSYSRFLPSEMTFVSYLILALIIIAWQTGMMNLNRVSPIGFRIMLILWTILLTYSGHWILIVILIWLILSALIPIIQAKRTWIWNILIGCLIFIISITFHLWTGSARLIDQQSRFLFREDRYLAQQTIRQLDRWTPTQFSVPNDQEFPFLYYSIPDDLEHSHRLPYPYYHFWMLNKSDLIQHDSLQQGIFYYENQPFYYMSQTTPQGHFILLPSLKKNYQYWLDRQSLYPIRLDELRLITMLDYDFFTIRYREYHHNLRVESSRPESYAFPVRIQDLNPETKLNQIIIKVQDYYLDGHWLAICYAWPDRFRLLTVWIKNYLLLSGLLLLLAGLVKYAHAPSLIHSLIDRLVHSSFLTKLIAVQSISLLLLMISLFYLTRESLQKYSLQQLEAGFVQHQQNFDDHFLLRVDFMERQLTRILDQYSVTGIDSFHEETDSLSIIFYLFDSNGQLVHHNFPVEWLDDKRKTELERSDQPDYRLDLIHGQLFMLLTTPCRIREGISGKALLAAPITQAELEYLFDTKGIAFTFYLKDRNILTETGLFFSRLFPMMINFRDYFRMLNNQSASFLEHNSHSATYTAKSRLFSDDNLGLISFRVPLESPVLQTVNNQYFISFILLTALAIIMIGLINRQLTRHLSQITDFIPSILENQPDRRLPIKGHDEFSLLSRTINHLSENLQREKEKTLQLEKERLVNELAREIAHEIKNPLTPMRLSLQHLNDVYREDPTQFMSVYPPIAQRLQNQIEILNQLSRKFLAVSRFEIGPLEAIDPVPILKELAALYNQDQSNPHIDLKPMTSSGLIMANRSSLNQLFVNLIKNSIEASPENNPSITIDLRRDGTRLEILINDQGSGIPEELRQRIFLPYYTTKISGSGLGLTICKKIMDHLAGEISLKPNYPQGTTARLVFPLVDDRDRSAPQVPDQPDNGKHAEST